jgi:hypothetical protein
MKKFQLLFLISFTIFQFVNGQKISPQSMLVCYGSEVKLNLSEYFEGDIISWQYAYEENGVFTPIFGKNNTVLQWSTVGLNKSNIYIQAKINGTKKSNTAVISFYKDIDFLVNIERVCIDQSNSFSAISDQNLNFKWYLNDQLIGTGKSIDFISTTAGKYLLKIIGENEFGCSKILLKEFVVNPQPNIEIEVSQVVCGNDTNMISLNRNDEVLSVVGITIWEGSTKYSKYDIVKNDKYSYTIKWQESNLDKQLKVQVDYKTQNGCIYSKAKDFLLLHEVTPEPGEVFRKAKGSNLLIYHPNGEIDLNFEWGYTGTDLKDIIINAINRPYALFESIKTGFHYWVDVSSLTNRYCKLRVFYKPENDPKYQTVLSANIFPNPVSEILKIEIPENTSKLTVSIFRMDGVLAKTKQYDNNSGIIQISVSELKNGLYHILISDDTCKEFSKTVFINNLF